MSSFKVGDRVRCVMSSYWTAPRGREGTIVRIKHHTSSPTYVVDFGAGFDGHDGGMGLKGTKWTKWYLEQNDLVKVDTLVLGTPTIADDLRLTPQARKVLAHLSGGKSITQLKAGKVYDIDRLADAIWKIKKVGYKIDTTLHTDEHGKRYAEYSLKTAVAA